MEKLKKLRAEFGKILHTLYTYVYVKAHTPLGYLLIESILIVLAVYILNEIAEWLGSQI